MGILSFCRASSSFLVHLSEILARIHCDEIHHPQHRGNDLQLFVLITGHEITAAGNFLRRLDRNRRAGSRHRGNPSLQRSFHTGPDVLCIPASVRNHWSESHLRPLRPAYIVFHPKSNEEALCNLRTTEPPHFPYSFLIINNSLP